MKIWEKSLRNLNGSIQDRFEICSENFRKTFLGIFFLGICIRILEKVSNCGEISRYFRGNLGNICNFPKFDLSF